MQNITKYFRLVIFSGIVFFSSINLYPEEQKPFTWEDAMKFKSLRHSTISYDGSWAAWDEIPDRGDGRSVFQSVFVDTLNYEIERGSYPKISNDNNWGACYINGKALDIENAKSPADKPKKKLNLINLKTGTQLEYDEVRKFEFSNDSKWLVFMHYDYKDVSKKGKNEKKNIGSKFVLKHLESGTDIVIDFVDEFELDSASQYLIYNISEPDGKKDGLYYRNLTKPFAPEETIEKNEEKYFGKLKFNTDIDNIAYLTASRKDDGEPDDCELKVYNLNNGLKRTLIDTSNFPSQLYVPAINDLNWTIDDKRLFFGYRMQKDKDTTDKKDVDFKESNFYSVDTIMMNRDLKMWHWDDPRINPHQIKWWQQNKDKTYLAVYDFSRGNYTLLADSTLPDVNTSEHDKYTLGYDDTKYQKEITYKGWFTDLYLVNMITGQEQLIETRLEEPAHLSPYGDYIIYFKDELWYIYFIKQDTTKLLTEDINANFYDEENDIPADPRSYGFDGFIKGGRKGFLLNDRYDIWQFHIIEDKINAINLTDAIGRERDITFRVKHLDKDKKFHHEGDTLMVHAFHNKEKWRAIYEIEISLIGPLKRIKEDKKYFNLLAMSEDGNRYLYTRQSFSEFPDLWVAEKAFDSTYRVSNLNKQKEGYLWGYSEVVSWESPRGDSLQGYLIKPDNYDPDKKYPVIVFFYEQMSDRAFTFWQPRIFHLISYQIYFPDDYVFFLPDIKYEEGNPGFDALAAINSGCQYLIDEGIAHPDKIGLQGHSWSGYQAAFMITQTDMYAAAVVGAPVGNMTSAYSGIRIGSGLARQFQYEKYQSRIGGNLWDSLDNYINNSPIFHAPKANTPMLIYHGDVDEAVPFSQGVELFLAFRRLNKEAILLEYDNEPHHPRKYENKLDYAIKMKEFYDHFLLGKPAPKWIKEGYLYKGK